MHVASGKFPSLRDQLPGADDLTHLSPLTHDVPRLGTRKFRGRFEIRQAEAMCDHDHADVSTIDVVLPVLDEREAIPWVLERLPATIEPIVVDNGSTDGSAALARRLGARVIHQPTPGFGAACFAGLQAATADVVCFMDCDGSLDPSHLTVLTSMVQEGAADLVLGARVPEPGAWPVHARTANRYLAWRLRRRFGWTVTDLGPMRSARREALLGLRLVDRRSGWPLEMVVRAGHAGWRVAEVPVPYGIRSGRSKVTGTVAGTARAISDMHIQLRTLG